MVFSPSSTLPGNSPTINVRGKPSRKGVEKLCVDPVRILPIQTHHRIVVRGKPDVCDLVCALLGWVLLRNCDNHNFFSFFPLTLTNRERWKEMESEYPIAAAKTK